MRIDLHAHSTASDGTTSPAQLVRDAAAAGLDVIALTDHDTTDGWEPATEALPRGLTLVPGAELSCRWYHTDHPIGLHLLAYLFDPTHRGLVAEMARVRSDRERRAEHIVDRMRRDGVDVTYEEVLRHANGGTVGRPHLAQALISRGLVATVEEAFAPEYLGERWRVAKRDMDVFEAIGLVRAAGGVPVFAHPRATKRGRIVPDEVIVEMAGHGLFGLEVDHTDHTPEQRAHLRALAGRLGLVATGSSDYHGTNKPIPLGANLTAPEVYERLVAEGTGATPKLGAWT